MGLKADGVKKAKRKPPLGRPEGCKCFFRSKKHSEKCPLNDAFKDKKGLCEQLGIGSKGQEMLDKLDFTVEIQEEIVEFAELEVEEDCGCSGEVTMEDNKIDNDKDLEMTNK